MTLFLVYAGKRGSGLECTLALYNLSKELGLNPKLILSTDNERRKKVLSFFPQAEFYNFLSPTDTFKLKKKLETGLSIFTMFSPKIVPLFKSLKSKKIFYFHATYDHSFSKITLGETINEHLTDSLVRSSTLSVATQYPLAWQLRIRLDKRAEVLPPPSYATIPKGFFDETSEIHLPFKKFFLTYGGLNRPSKGVDVLLEALKGTSVPAVVAGNCKLIKQKNVFHINRWITDAELHGLINRCKCVVLPYLVPSLFSGCMALSFHFRKPILAPFSSGFEHFIEKDGTGWFFSSGNWESLREKMDLIWSENSKYDANLIASKETQMDYLTKVKLKEISERFGGS